MEGKSVFDVEDEESIYVPLSISWNRISHVSLTLCYMGRPGLQEKARDDLIMYANWLSPKEILLLRVRGWRGEGVPLDYSAEERSISLCMQEQVGTRAMKCGTFAVMAVLFKEKGTTVTAHGIMTSTITYHRHHHHYRRNQPHSREPNHCSPQRCKLSTCWAAAGYEWELLPLTPRLLTRHKSRFLLILEEI